MLQPVDIILLPPEVDAPASAKILLPLAANAPASVKILLPFGKASTAPG